MSSQKLKTNVGNLGSEVGLKGKLRSQSRSGLIQLTNLRNQDRQRGTVKLKSKWQPDLSLKREFRNRL